jgi:hypothetical protein
VWKAVGNRLSRDNAVALLNDRFLMNTRRLVRAQEIAQRIRDLVAVIALNRDRFAGNFRNRSVDIGCNRRARIVAARFSRPVFTSGTSGRSNGTA